MPPLNRIVAFAGPYISLTAGTLATLLFAKLNVLGIQGLTESDLAAGLAAVFTFGLTTVVTWLGQASWLKGHQVELAKQQARPLGVPISGTLGTRLTAGDGISGAGIQSGSGTTAEFSMASEPDEPPPLTDGELDDDPLMGEPLEATPESYVGDPKDKAGAKDHPA